MAGGFAEQLAKAASKKQNSQGGASLSSSFAEQLRQRAELNGSAAAPPPPPPPPPPPQENEEGNLRVTGRAIATERRPQNRIADNDGEEKNRGGGGATIDVSISPTHTASALKTVTPTATQTETLSEDDRKSDGIGGDNDDDGTSHVSAASGKASKHSIAAVPASPIPQCSQEGNIKVREVDRETNTASTTRRVDSSSKLQQQLQRASRRLRPSPSKVAQCSGDTGVQDESVFGAWAQIETLKQRVKEAEERAMSESQRADEISAELRSRDPVHDSHVDSNSDSASGYIKVRGEETRIDSADSTNEIIEASKAIASEVDGAEQWKRRALEAERRLVVEGRIGLPAREGPALYDDEEDSEIINLKNKEIAVLRRQIRRLEKLVADERERALYVRDGPLVFASECSLTADSSQTPSTEFRLLRNEIRSLQFQLRSKEDRNSAVSMSGGSTLSSLDNDERNSTFENAHPPLRAQVIVRGDGSPAPAEEQEELVPDESITQSSWSLCACLTSRKPKGYGRV